MSWFLLRNSIPCPLLLLVGSFNALQIESFGSPQKCIHRFQPSTRIMKQPRSASGEPSLEINGITVRIQHHKIRKSRSFSAAADPECKRWHRKHKIWISGQVASVFWVDLNQNQSLVKLGDLLWQKLCIYPKSISGITAGGASLPPADRRYPPPPAGASMSTSVVNHSGNLANDHVELARAMPINWQGVATSGRKHL